jgi:hypothetical protein
MHFHSRNGLDLKKSLLPLHVSVLIKGSPQLCLIRRPQV